MPAKKGVAKSAAHKKSIATSVGKYYQGGKKTRDGVKSNNKFDDKKRLRRPGTGKNTPAYIDDTQTIRAAGNKLTPSTNPVFETPVKHSGTTSADAAYGKSVGATPGVGVSGPAQVKASKLTSARNPFVSGVGQTKNPKTGPKLTNEQRVAEIQSGRDAKFSPVNRKDYTKSKKKQAKEGKVFGGRPGKGPQGKKGIIMGQSEGATESQPKQFGGLAQSDDKMLKGSGAATSSAQRLGYTGAKKQSTEIRGSKRRKRKG